MSKSRPRPTHSRLDTVHELQVSKRLEYCLGIKCVRTEPRCFYDLKCHDECGNVTDIIEIKYRNIFWGQFPTIHISEKKVIRCLEEAKRLGVGFHFAVLCESGLFMTRLNSAVLLNLPRKQGGRWDRGLSSDVETLIDIPIGHFSKI